MRFGQWLFESLTEPSYFHRAPRMLRGAVARPTRVVSRPPFCSSPEILWRNAFEGNHEY